MRVLHQQHADLQKLFLSVGKQPGPAVALALRRSKTSISSMRSRCSPLSFARRLAQTDLSVFMAIFPHRQRFKDRGFLEFTPDALAGDGRRLQRGQVDGLIVNRPPLLAAFCR
jgi:hypothetical protein